MIRGKKTQPKSSKPPNDSFFAWLKTIMEDPKHVAVPEVLPEGTMMHFKDQSKPSLLVIVKGRLMELVRVTEEKGKTKRTVMHKAEAKETRAKVGGKDTVITKWFFPKLGFQVSPSRGGGTYTAYAMRSTAEVAAGGLGAYMAFLQRDDKPASK